MRLAGGAPHQKRVGKKRGRVRCEARCVTTSRKRP